MLLAYGGGISNALLHVLLNLAPTDLISPFRRRYSIAELTEEHLLLKMVRFRDKVKSIVALPCPALLGTSMSSIATLVERSILKPSYSCQERYINQTWFASPTRQCCPFGGVFDASFSVPNITRSNLFSSSRCSNSWIGFYNKTLRRNDHIGIGALVHVAWRTESMLELVVLWADCCCSGV